MALLLSLPVAFVALVPGTAVSSGVKTLLDVIAFVFPFKAALEAVSNAFSGASPGDGRPARAPGGAGGASTSLSRGVAVRRFA